MTKRNSPERKSELTARREKQLAATPTKAIMVRGKYTPAGANKNTKPYNR